MTIVVRQNPKQSWKQAKALPLVMTEERVLSWVDALNATEGWAKYAGAQA